MFICILFYDFLKAIWRDIRGLLSSICDVALVIKEGVREEGKRKGEGNLPTVGVTIQTGSPGRAHCIPLVLCNY